MTQTSFSFDASLLVRDVCGEYRPALAEEVLQAAQRLLSAQVRGSDVMNSPQVVRNYLRVKLGLLEHELFTVLMLDAQYRLIECVELFRGTVCQAAVYPREVVKEALAFNAAAVILCHNHPSGGTEPSSADERLTQTLKAALALALVDVRVVDHLIVAGDQVVSFAEQGLL